MTALEMHRSLDQTLKGKIEQAKANATTLRFSGSAAGAPPAEPVRIRVRRELRISGPHRAQLCDRYSSHLDAAQADALLPKLELNRIALAVGLPSQGQPDAEPG